MICPFLNRAKCQFICLFVCLSVNFVVIEMLTHLENKTFASTIHERIIPEGGGSYLFKIVLRLYWDFDNFCTPVEP